MAVKTKLTTRKERLRGAGVSQLAEVGPDDNLSKSEATLDEALALCESKIKSLAMLAPESLDANELYKISNSATGLVRAKIESRRWDAERGGLLLEAESRIQAELRELLKSDPELVERIHALAHTARLKLESAPILVE